MARTKTVSRMTASQEAALKTSIGNPETVEQIIKAADTPQAAQLEEQEGLAGLVKLSIELFAGCSWQRFIVAIVTTLATSILVGVALGNFLAWLAVSVAMGTGSLVLTVLVMALGLLLSYAISKRISAAVYTYVASGKVDVHYDRMKQGVANFFSSKKEVVASATTA
jgi:hypothetical protein